VTAEAQPRSTVALGPPGAGRRAARFGHAEVLAAIAALSFLVARFVPVLGVLPPCPLRAAFGVPCASCGMTRAFVAMAHGDVAAAAAASPLGAALALAAWGFALAALLRPVLGFSWPELAPRVARALALTGIFALLANWGWLVNAWRANP
jgi:hypothetical protein